jgi:hypothetical protein
LNVTISPSASDSSEDGDSLVTATEAADLLGVSYNTIVNWENAGRLHAHEQRRLLTNGQHREIRVFKDAEVRKFLRRRDPNDEDEAAARAFEIFQEGRPIREIVTALRVRPERIERLRDQCHQSRPIFIAPSGRPRQRTPLLRPRYGHHGIRLMATLHEWLRAATAASWDDACLRGASPPVPESGARHQHSYKMTSLCWRLQILVSNPRLRN